MQESVEIYWQTFFCKLKLLGKVLRSMWFNVVSIKQDLNSHLDNKVLIKIVAAYVNPALSIEEPRCELSVQKYFPPFFISLRFWVN